MHVIKVEPSYDVSITEIRTCFICNNKSNTYTEEISTMKSQYSETRICDLIERCLGGNRIHRRFDDEPSQSIICGDCLLKINEYDLACVTAERVGHELQQMLLHTDSIYVNKIEVPTIDELHLGQREIKSDASNYSFDENVNDCYDDIDIDNVQIKCNVDEEINADADADELLGNENECEPSDAECSSTESIEKPNEPNEKWENSRSKRTWECDTCPEKFSLWKELRVSTTILIYF